MYIQFKYVDLDFDYLNMHMCNNSMDLRVDVLTLHFPSYWYYRIKLLS